MNYVNPQQQHYENVHDDYGAHYYDASAMDYRREFVFRPLFAGLNLNGAHVADLACGSGFNSTLLREYYPEVKTDGFDISPRACEDYRRNLPGGNAYQCDLTQFYSAPRQYDAAMIFGGLHHCVMNLQQTLDNISGMIRPGGWLFMVEPNRRYILQTLRDFWYRNDRYFDAATERALVHDELLAMAPQFKLMDVKYYGGPAYFMILNSLITRMPLKAKARLQTPLFAAEHVYNRLPGSDFSLYFRPVGIGCKFTANLQRARHPASCFGGFPVAISRPP